VTSLPSMRPHLLKVLPSSNSNIGWELSLQHMGLWRRAFNIQAIAMCHPVHVMSFWATRSLTFVLLFVLGLVMAWFSPPRAKSFHLHKTPTPHWAPGTHFSFLL
jgi:hypothetical protein